MGFPLINHPFGVPLFVETPKWLLWRHSWGFRVSASGAPLGQRAWLNVGGSRSTEIWTPWKPGAWRRARHPGEKGILIFADISRDSPWLSFHFQLQGWAIQGLQESQETKTNAFSWRFPILFGKSRLPCSWTFLNMIHLSDSVAFFATGVQKHRIFGPFGTSGLGTQFRLLQKTEWMLFVSCGQIWQGSNVRSNH